MSSSGPLHTQKQVLYNQLDHIYNSSVPIQYLALKNSRERWIIDTCGKRGSGKTMLAARRDDDDDDDIYIYTNPSARVGYDKMSIFKRIFTGLNLEFSSPRLFASSGLKNQSALLLTPSWRENNWIHTFPKVISAMWNAIGRVCMCVCVNWELPCTIESVYAFITGIYTNI